MRGTNNNEVQLVPNDKFDVFMPHVQEASNRFWLLSLRVWLEWLPTMVDKTAKIYGKIFLPPVFQRFLVGGVTSASQWCHNDIQMMHLPPDLHTHTELQFRPAEGQINAIPKSATRP